MPTKLCQYQHPHCQKTAQFQHILKLGAVKIDKGYICQNCKEFISNSLAADASGDRGQPQKNEPFGALPLLTGRPEWKIGRKL